MNNLPESELAHLLRVSWIVLIPAGVLLSLVLYKLAMLLHGLLDFVTLARYELVPAIKDLRRTAENVEILTSKTVSSIQNVEDGLAATGPALRSLKDRLAVRAESLWAGLRRSFARR